MVIDAHVHIYDVGFWAPRWFDNVAYRWAYGAGPGRGAAVNLPLAAASRSSRNPDIIRPSIEPGMADPEGQRMVQQMDAARIDSAVILPLDWEIGFKQKQAVPIKEIHERYASMVKRHPDRFIAFAGLDPQRPDVVDIFEWAIKTLGMRGLKLYPPTGFYPYDERAYPLYERCEAWGLPVLIHTGGTIALMRPRFANPLFLQDVQADFPKLTIWLGHAGAPFWWEEAVWVVGQAANTYLELSNWEELAFSEEDVFIRQLARARDKLGAHRLLFGSDHFSGSAFRGEEKLIRWRRWFDDLPSRAHTLGLSFTEEEIALILGGNAERCLAPGAGLGP